MKHLPLNFKSLSAPLVTLSLVLIPLMGCFPEKATENLLYVAKGPDLTPHQKNYWHFMNEFIKKPIQPKPGVLIKKVSTASAPVTDEVINQGVPTAKITSVTSPGATSRALKVEFDYANGTVFSQKAGNKVKKTVIFTFPRTSSSDGKVVEAFMDGKNFPLYFSKDEAIKSKNRSFFSHEVILALLLSAQALEDQNYATAVTELLRDANLLQAVQSILKPYLIILKYRGQTSENINCIAEGILNADGHIVGMRVFKSIGESTKSSIFSVFGAIPIIKQDVEKKPLACSVYHKSLRTWLAHQTFVDTKQSFSEQENGTIDAFEKNVWQKKVILGEVCGTSTYTIQACNGTIKANFLEETDFKTPLGDGNRKDLASFECNNLTLEKMEIGAFITPEVVTKVMQRPIFGRSALP